MNVRRWLASSIPLLVMAIGVAIIQHANAMTTIILVVLAFGVGALVSKLDAVTRDLTAKARKMGD